MKTCAAPAPLGLAPSFGFGDRLGLATPGHVEALKEAGGEIRGIFAQQSIREMTRTGRTPGVVLQAASDALGAIDYGGPWAADADHLKTPADVRTTVAAGFVFFTLDPSDDVDQTADGDDRPAFDGKLTAAREFAPWIEHYRGRTVRLDSGPIVFDEPTLARAAVKYGKALARAMTLARSVMSEAAAAGRPYEIELSIDETAAPTSAAEHYIIAEQFQRADIPLASLAPRFVGRFEKGVEYIGEAAALEDSMKVHAEIADRLGPYKISLHSGSDKLSMYPLLARTTGGRFHVKTAGTSYLEAIRVAAHHDAELFREIIAYSRSRFDADKESYCVSATVDQTPDPDDLTDPVLLEQAYLDRWEDTPQGRGFTAPGRQILHCTFGSVLTHPRLGSRLVQLVENRPDEYREILRQHFVRHLAPLRE